MQSGHFGNGDPFAGNSQYGVPNNLPFPNMHEQLRQRPSVFHQNMPGTVDHSNSASVSGCDLSSDQRASKSRRTSLMEATSTAPSEHDNVDNADAGTEDTAQHCKTLALQAKNRRAQQRFRERQKARVSELLDQVDDLSEKLKKAEEEKADIDNHKNIVEKMVKMKEEHALAMAERIRVLEANSEEGGAGSGGDESVEVTNAQGEKVVLSKHRGMLDKLREIWRDYVNTLAGCLVEGGSENPSKEVVDSIAQLVSDACDVNKRTALYNPAVAREWFLSSMEDGTTQDSQNDKDAQVNLRAGHEYLQFLVVCETGFCLELVW